MLFSYVFGRSKHVSHNGVKQTRSEGAARQIKMASTLKEVFHKYVPRNLIDKLIDFIDNLKTAYYARVEKKQKAFQVEVLSRHEMSLKSGEETPYACVVSINTPGREHLDIATPVLYLDFNDTTDETGISMMDAHKISIFVSSNVAQGNKHIIVHCDQGISRSAGVAAAILKAYNMDEDIILKNSRYCINPRCYEYVCKAFRLPITPEQVREAQNKSRAAYLSEWPTF